MMLFEIPETVTLSAHHTSGMGFMLAANGAAEINRVLWRQSVGVTMNTPYEFSGWAASWGDDGTGHDLNPARVRISVNGSVAGSAFQLSNVDGQWQSFSFPWTSTATGSAMIELWLETTDFLGNDPAFDDFQFTVVPEPNMLSLLSGAAILALLWLGYWRKHVTGSVTGSVPHICKFDVCNPNLPMCGTDPLTLTVQWPPHDS